MSTLARDLGKASLKPPPSGRHPSKSVLQGYHFLGVLRLDSLTSLEEQLALFGEALGKGHRCLPLGDSVASPTTSSLGS